MAPTAAVSQVFRAVTVTSLDHSPTLATAVAGGVLRRAVLTLPGTAPCVTTLAMWTGTTTVSDLGSLSVASGIRIYLPDDRQV